MNFKMYQLNISEVLLVNGGGEVSTPTYQGSASGNGMGNGSPASPGTNNGLSGAGGIGV